MHFFQARRDLVIALVLFGLFLLEFAWLSRLIHLDLAVYDWMQAYRSCRLDRLASILRDWTTRPYATVLLMTAMAGWLAYCWRWQDFGRLVIIVAGGALLSEWVKEFVSRPRPSGLAFVEYGSSFPSGHVTSAVTIFGAAYYLVIRCYLHRQWQRWVALAGAAALVALIALQRVYFTHHWVSDALGGALLGGAWLFFALDHFSFRVNRRSTLVIATVFAGAFIILRVFPSLRVSSLAPMASRGAHLSFVDLAAYAPDFIERRESRLGAGRTSEATWHFFKPTTTIDLPLAHAGDYYLVFAARPRNPLGSAGCRSITLLLNDRPISNMVIYNGWRDYRIALERDWLNSGSNRLTVNLGPGENNAMIFTTLAIHARTLSR